MLESTHGQPPLQWPYAALVLGSVLAVRALLSMPKKGAFRNSAWLLSLLLPAYQLHQFEEHGIDLQGNRYAFQAHLCRTIGIYDIQSCPANDAFIAAVNVGAVWISCALAWLAGTAAWPRLGVGAAATSILLINAIMHLKPAVQDGQYNPGLATGVLLFLPISLATLSSLVMVPAGRHKAGPAAKPPAASSKALLSVRGLAAALGVGVLLHVVIIACLLLRKQGLMSGDVMVVAQVLNGFMPLVLAGVRPM